MRTTKEEIDKDSFSGANKITLKVRKKMIKCPECLYVAINSS